MDSWVFSSRHQPVTVDAVIGVAAEWQGVCATALPLRLAIESILIM
jgi:hypothetical protein